MKSSLSTLLHLAGVFAVWPISAGGQGTVQFETRAVLISTNSVHGGPSTGLTWDQSVYSNAYYYALLVAPTNQLTVDSSLAGWTFTGDYATNARAGQVWGNYTRDIAVVVPGYPAGSSANFVVVGWSANVGHDWGVISPLIQDGAIADLGFFAISQVGVGLVLAGGATPPSPVLGLNTWQIPGFTLDAPIPEPSALSLAALGAGILWKARRRLSRVRVRAVRRRPEKP